MVGLPVLAQASRLIVMQRKEMLEVFTGIETRNRYVVQTPEGDDVLFVAELGGGTGSAIARLILKNRRPFVMNVTSSLGSVDLVLRRPWSWFFSELHVSDGQGNVIGSIQQRFKIFGRRFDVLDSIGRICSTIRGPLFRPWTFKVLTDEQDSGLISKKWSGLLKESFTDADTFGVEFGAALSSEQRSLILAATFLIDFLYFENSN